MKPRQGMGGEARVEAKRDDCTGEQSVLLYHKFDNARGTSYAQAGAVERDVAETMEEDARGSGCSQPRLVELVDNAQVGCRVGLMTVEIGYGSYRHGCAIDDGKKGQPRQWPK